MPDNLPVSGSTDWYAHYSSIDSDVRALLARLTAFGEANVAGRYYSAAKTGTTLATVATVADRLYLAPIQIKIARPINQLGCNVTTAAAGNVRLGIYNVDPATNLPSTVRLDGGVATPDTSTTGAKTATVSATIPAGNYYMALTCSGTATFTAAGVGEMEPIAGAPTLTNAPANIAYVTHSQANALPDLTGATLTWATASVPLAQMRAA